MWLVELSWTGRGGMFLAPAGNPSSLRVGHPDVATEHTGLSSTSLPPSPGRWSSGCGCAAGMRTAATRCGKSVRGEGKEYSGWVPQTAYRGKQIGIWVPRWFRRDVGALTCRLAVKGLIEKGLAVAPCARYTLPSLLQGHPPSLRFGHPDVASGRYSAPSTRLKSLKNVQLTTQLC